MASQLEQNVEDQCVQEYCDKVDKYLERFKRRRDLKTTVNTDDWMIFKDISDLKPGPDQTAIASNLATRPEIFEIFSLVWKNQIKGKVSSNVDNTKVCNVLESIRNLIFVSNEMCAAFGEKELLQMILEDLKKGALNDELTRTALTIAYNCCWRVHSNQEICREYKDVFQELTQSGQLDIQADAFLTLSYIVSKLETHRLALEEPCVRFLMMHMKSSLSKSKKKSPTEHQYSPLEITKGINQLALNERNKILIAELGGLDILMRVLVEANSSEEERLWAARGIWQLAFKEENKAKIRKIKTFFATLNRIKKTTKNLGLREACSGALFLVDDVVDCKNGSEKKAKERLGTKSEASAKTGEAGVKSGESGSPDVMTGTPGEHVMISYQWGSQKRMLQVKKYLEKHGYNVWMDIERMQGDILNTMAEAVQNAAVVLVAASQKYSESQNCRTEAQYAYKQKKPVIPLMLEDRFEPTGWLGALMGMEKYFPVFTDNLMKKTLPDLVKCLGERGKREEGKGASTTCQEEEIDTAEGANPSVNEQTPDEEEKTSGDLSGEAANDKLTDKKRKEDSRVKKMFSSVKLKVPLLDRP